MAYSSLKRNQYQDNHNNLVNLTYIKQIHSYNTRSQVKDNLYTPSVKSEMGKSSLEYNLSEVWNEMPTDIRQSKHINSQHLKDQIQRAPYYKIQ